MMAKIEIFTPFESQNPIYLGSADEDLFEDIIKEHGNRTFAEIKALTSRGWRYRLEPPPQEDADHWILGSDFIEVLFGD